MPPAENVHAGVAACVRRNDSLLLVQRGSRASYADGYGTWGMPGGWLEWGETAFDAARREVEEETGLIVRPVAHDNYHVHTAKSGLHCVTLWVVCEYQGGEPENREPEKQIRVQWMPEMLLGELDLFTPLDAWWRRPR